MLWKGAALFAQDTEAGGHVVAAQLMAAAGAKLVSGADGAEAVAAVGFELKVALGAEVEVALDVGGARRAAGDDGLAEEEVEDSANSARHDKADDDPEAGAHGAAGGVFADVADHEEVEGGEEAPGEVEVDAEAERRLVVLPCGQHQPEIVFDQHKCQAGDEDQGSQSREPGSRQLQEQTGVGPGRRFSTTL